jgi:hypothetical protein
MPFVLDPETGKVVLVTLVVKDCCFDAVVFHSTNDSMYDSSSPKTKQL